MVHPAHRVSSIAGQQWHPEGALSNLQQWADHASGPFGFSR